MKMENKDNVTFVIKQFRYNKTNCKILLEENFYNYLLKEAPKHKAKGVKLTLDIPNLSESG